MIYATCPTCGFLLASVSEKYETKKKKYVITQIYQQKIKKKKFKN